MVEIKRKTKETDIISRLELYGSGKSSINTSIGFFDHMLESFTKHGLLDLQLSCDGDIDVDYHHSVEDVGIVIGESLRREIFPIENVERFGEATVVMDEASVNTALDLSNRPYLHFDIDLTDKIGDFDVELIEEFFRALCFNAGITAHIVCQRGKNKHHIVEAAFKSFAIALRRATSKNSRVGVPSTKGIL